MVLYDPLSAGILRLVAVPGNTATPGVIGKIVDMLLESIVIVLPLIAPGAPAAASWDDLFVRITIYYRLALNACVLSFRYNIRTGNLLALLGITTRLAVTLIMR